MTQAAGCCLCNISGWTAPFHAMGTKTAIEKQIWDWRGESIADVEELAMITEQR